MAITDADPLLGELTRLGCNPSLPSYLTDQIKKLQLELRFLKMFFWCFANWDDAATDARLGPLVTNIAVQLRKAGQGLYAAGLIAIQRQQTDNWNILASNFLEKVEHLKPEIAEICLILLNRSFQCNFSTSYEILDFISTILENLKDLLNSKAIISGPIEMQIEELEQILWVLKSFVDFTAPRAITYEKLEDFWNHVQGCTNRAASVAFLFWVGERVREANKSEIDDVLSDLVQKIESFTPEAIEMYLGVLKASKFSRSDTSLIGEVVASFVDFFLKNLQVSMKDDISVLAQDLMFLIVFLMDPPELSGKLIRTKIDAIVGDIASFICSFPVDQTREKQNKFPLELFRRIDKVKAEIKELYVHISDSSLSDFPKTNGSGYINFLLRKIDEMLKCDANVKTFAKYQIVTIQKELVRLQSFLKLRNEHDQLENIWMQMINVAYRAEHAIDTCLIMDAPLWYHMIRLSDVTEQMKLIKVDVEKMEAKQMKIPVLSDEMKSRIDVLNEAKFSTTDVVGFEDDARRIILGLTGGSVGLEIVSIVGMPGIGMTTLAMKVFYHLSTRYYFFKRVWCHVSQAHNVRKSLFNMLNSFSVRDKLTSELSDKQLAGELYKCLKGNRFLIVLDDIWDIEVLHELRKSIPDDHNGSRILLTSQILNVALQANPNKHPYVLRPPSDEESWNLLKVNLFASDVCPPELLEVGQRIGEHCKGQPLTIVSIAGSLAGEKIDLHEGELIALTSAFPRSKCMDILELSYKHMPDVLKSCFLYFATFQKGTVMKVKRLCRLWIAEGFVPKTEGKSLEDVANEYLMDLISRGLVIVDNRSFSERIKECHVHDILHSLCVTKSEEEGFFQLVNTSRLQPNDVRYNQYRLCIHSEWRHFVNSKPTSPNVRSLLFHPNNSSNRHPYIPEVFNSFQFLRVLDLEGLSWGVLFPEEVVSLTHLRYLAVAGDFTSIPSSIDNLSYLEALCLQNHDSIIVLPNTICNMKMLRHVDIPTGAVVSWDDYDIQMSSCLHNLFTFSSLFISPREDAEMLLKMLPRVRRLRFQFYNQFPAVDFLDNLESLKVHKVGRASCSYLSIFPSTLRELTLSNLGLPWREMSAIAKLPNIEALKLLSRSFEGLFWYIRKDEFLKLKILKLEGLNIAGWRADYRSLPCLQRLMVKDCVKLGTIPDNFADSDTLNIIEVHECSSSVAKSASKISEQRFGRIQIIITPKVAEEHSSSSQEGGLSKMSVDQKGVGLRKRSVNQKEVPRGEGSSEGSLRT